jgi:hypothetical protein
MRPLAVSGTPDGLGKLPVSGSIFGAVLVLGLLWYLNKK